MHAGAESIWTEAIAKDSKAFNLSTAQDAARDKVKKTLESEDIRFDKDDFTQTPDSLIDDTVSGVKSYVSLADSIEIPQMVEKFLSFDIGDDFEIAGTVDFIAKDGTISDIKTSSKKSTPQQHIAQLGVYRRLAQLNGIESPSKSFGIQNIAFTSKAVTGYLLEAKHDMNMVSYLVDQIKTRTQLVLQNELEIDLYFPTNPSSYLCAEKYCPFWAQCDAVEGRR